MRMENPLTVGSRARWRAWLRRNHTKASEAWLVFFKRHTGEPSIPYDDAVEEALCFGWIDSVIQRIDDDRYARKFTPRKNGANWSPSNKARVAMLIREGRMTAAGLAKVGYEAPEVGPTAAPRPSAPSLAAPLARALRANASAFTAFRALAPSHRREYVTWIMSAKKDVTRERRLREAMRKLAKREPLGMK